jgi:glutaredoxin
VRTLKVYGRPDCHLCDEALAAIQSLRGELEPFDLEQVDIDSDDRLLAAFLERIPVVEVDGKIVSELELDEPALRGALRRPGP